MGSLCCNLKRQSKSSKTNINEGLSKLARDRPLITLDSTPCKCIQPVSMIAPSNTPSEARMQLHQNSGCKPFSVAYRQTTMDTIKESIKPSDDQLYQFMDFPFLTSLSVIRWMMASKIVFILRGPSGSGKSTIVDCLTDKFPKATVCSPDHYFLQRDGTLKCDRSQLSAAESFCQNEAYQALESGKSPVIIDDAHIRCWDYKYYVDVSLKFDYLIMMVVPKTPWRFDAEQLHVKSLKSEPIWEIEKSINQFDPALPLFFGWFLNDIDSDHILQLATDLLNMFVTFPEIRIDLAAACNLPEYVSKEDLIDNWTIKTDRLHVTTKFCGYGTTTDSDTYFNSGYVQQSLGQLFPIHIKGLLLTPRTVSCHIQLAGPKQIQLWSGDDQEDVAATITKSPSKPASLSKMTGFSKLNGTKPFRRPFGCRAHMTLMQSDGVRQVQSGLDQLQIIDLQLRNEKGNFVEVVESGTITGWGQGRYYIEFCSSIICQALFTGQY